MILLIILSSTKNTNNTNNWIIPTKIPTKSPIEIDSHKDSHREAGIGIGTDIPTKSHNSYEEFIRLAGDYAGSNHLNITLNYIIYFYCPR